MGGQILYIAKGLRVGLRAWARRRDRSEIESWPAVQFPRHWSATGTTSGDRIPFALDLVATGALIGRLTLREIHDGQARVGIYLHPNLTGQGYGREALALLKQHAESCGVRRLLLDVAADNERAIRAYRAVGFDELARFERDGHPFVEMAYAPA